MCKVVRAGHGVRRDGSLIKYMKMYLDCGLGTESYFGGTKRKRKRRSRQSEIPLLPSIMVARDLAGPTRQHLTIFLSFPAHLACSAQQLSHIEGERQEQFLSLGMQRLRRAARKGMMGMDCRLRAKSVKGAGGVDHEDLNSHDPRELGAQHWAGWGYRGEQLTIADQH